MSYTHTTFGALKTELAGRLGDPSRIFWTDTELGIQLTEALRTFGLLSGFWRERGTLPSSPALAFYDINSLLTSGIELLLAPTVTDRDIILQLQYALLEITPTEMFTTSDLANAVQNRRNQFLSDSGCVVHRAVVNVLSPQIGRETLDQSIIDVRRVAWLGAAPFNYYVTLWREDERMMTAAFTGWSVTATTPQAFSIMAPPPLQLQIAPPPISSGQLEMLTVDSLQLNPAATATVLGIPDDLTPAVKWGALADLLGIDGVARDLTRAQFAEQRYQQYVQLARLLPVVIHAELNGVPLIPNTLQEVDAYSPEWQNLPGTPTDIVLAAPNLIGLYPVPDALYSVTLDVVRKTPIPTSDAGYVQVGREQLDMVVDYAEHLALFKAAGFEWHATERQAQNFMLQSVTYNQRIAAAARAVVAAGDQSEREKLERPRRLESPIGTGAVRKA